MGEIPIFGIPWVLKSLASLVPGVDISYFCSRFFQLRRKRHSGREGGIQEELMQTNKKYAFKNNKKVSICQKSPRVSYYKKQCKRAGTR